MIKLFEKNETNFKHNENVMNESISCDITEEINESYEIEGEFPLDDSKNIAPLLVPGKIVSAPSWDTRPDQLFVIRRAKPNLNTVSYFAQHIAIAKLDNNVVLDTYIQGKTRQQAIAQILANTINRHNFIAGNKDTNASINNLRIVRYSALEAIKGNKDNTIINRYGGEVLFNNFELNVVDELGSDKGLRATYAKNITGAEATFEDLDLITEIIPVGSEGLMLPEKSIKANNFDPNNPFTRVVEFSDIGVVKAETDEEGNVTNADEVVTQEQAYEKLRQACRDKFNKDHVNKISFNLTLDLVELADCINLDGNDYSEINDRVAIGDTIEVNLKPLGIKQKGRVYKITRDAITGRLKNVEIGYKKANIVDTIKKTDSKIDETKEELKENIKNAKEEAANATNNLKVVMEKRDSEIELSVTNEAEQRKTEIKVMDGKIEQRVTSKEFSTYKSQTDREISQKVSQGDEFTSELKQNVDAFQFLFEEASGSKTEITRNGLTIYKGGIEIKDNRGNTVMDIDSNGVMRITAAGIKDLNIYDTSKGSMFFNTLANMDEISCGEIKPSRLTISSSDFYINDGYDLKEYIEKVVKNM